MGIYMIKAYMQVDLNNELALRYMEVALKSFERVSDIFEIEVIQCITPETLLPELIDNPLITHTKDQVSLRNRSPQELGSLHSNYRMIKRLAQGEKFWVLEHDAYLRPQHEDVFRMLMSKWRQFPAAGLGTAFEFYTMNSDISKIWINKFLSGTNLGPMGIMHSAIDQWSKTHNNNKRNIYWPANRFKHVEWTNKTGVDVGAHACHHRPKIIIDSPITQILDEKYGGTVIDRKKTRGPDGKYDKTILYNRTKHPDVEWITLDNN
jgi:hypothetical protein